MNILTHLRTRLTEVIIIHLKYLVYCEKCFKQQKRYPGEESPLQPGGHSLAAAMCPGYRDSHSRLLLCGAVGFPDPSSGAGFKAGGSFWKIVPLAASG